MRSKDFILGTLMAFGTLFLVASFWRQTFFLTAAIALLHTTYFLLSKNRKQLLCVYAIAFVAGPLAEALCIYFGAWSYSTPYVLGVPVWLGLVWGAAGVLFAHVANRASRR